MNDLLERIKERISEKDSPIHTVKALTEAIDMSEAGFYRMVKSGSIKQKTLWAICKVLDVQETYFTGESGAKVEDGKSYGQSVLDKIYSEMQAMKTDLMEQIHVKDKQLEAKDNQINMLLSLLGKIEGVIGRPLFSEVELLELGIVLP